MLVVQARALTLPSCEYNMTICLLATPRNNNISVFIEHTGLSYRVLCTTSLPNDDVGIL